MPSSSKNEQDNISEGLYQSPPPIEPDYDKLREAIENMTPTEWFAVVQRYIAAKYSGTPRQAGVYDQMIHRTTTGSDPLVQEPGP